MIALITTLSRAVRSMLKPTPSSMNGDRRPAIVMRRRAGLHPSGSLQDVDVLVVLSAPRCEFKDTPVRGELREDPLGGEEGGAPGGVHHPPVPLLAELGAVPPAAGVERRGDLARLLG